MFKSMRQTNNPNGRVGGRLPIYICPSEPRALPPLVSAQNYPQPTFYIGVAGTTAPVSRRMQRYFGLTAVSGVRVVEVGKGSPAALGGLRTDDIVVAIDAIAVDSVDGLQRTLDASRIDRAVSVTVLRGAQKLDLTLTPI